MVQPVEIVDDDVTLFKVVFTELQVFLEIDSGRHWDRSFVSKSLKHDHVEVIQFLGDLKCHSIV